MSDLNISDVQLQQVKAGFINSIINSVNVGTLVNIAAAKLSEQYSSLGATELRDAVISQTNIETWNQLMETLAPAEEAAAD